MKTPLVLLPGFGADQEMWQHQVTHLTDIADPKVLLLAEKSRIAMADAVLKEAPQHFVLVGHSMGGWVAQEVAARAPLRVLGLVLIGTWTRDNPLMMQGQATSLQMIEEGKIEEFVRLFVPMLVHKQHQTDTFLSGLNKMLSTRSPTVLCNQLRAMQGAYATDALLKQISAPTLVIHGRDDALFSLEEAQVLKRGIAKSELALIEECGHLPPLEQPQATTALIRLWLTAHA